MAKVRGMFVEMEGSDEAVLGALRAVTGLTQNSLTPPIPPVEIAAPVVDPPKALPAGASADCTEPHSPSRARAAGKQGRKPHTSTPAPAALPAAPEDSKCASAIVVALAKGPRTSGELMQLTKFSSGSVYPALAKLREQGRVEMIQDGADGQRKNKLVP